MKLKKETLLRTAWLCGIDSNTISMYLNKVGFEQMKSVAGHKLDERLLGIPWCPYGVSRKIAEVLHQRLRYHRLRSICRPSIKPWGTFKAMSKSCMVLMHKWKPWTTKCCKRASHSRTDGQKPPLLSAK